MGFGFRDGAESLRKGPPWIPSREGFGPMTSLTAEDRWWYGLQGFRVEVQGSGFRV